MDTEQDTTPEADPTPDTAGSPAAPGDDPGLSLDDMSDAQIDAIHKRIEERRANRPESIAKQLEELRTEISGASQAKHEASERRKQGRDEADQLDATIAKLQTQLRRNEMKEAADAAGFAKPGPVIDVLMSQEGDVAELVAAAAASGAYVMKKPAPSAPVGGPGSKGAPQMDPGRQALMDEIRQVQAGNVI